ncbi:MAG: lysoplasmalogenase [Anaerolineales bacterium]|nr:lysoplasmalogenase [Anaerolineales bacterium]
MGIETVLLLAAAVTAVFAIFGEYRPTRTLVYVFKPLTTGLIIVLALLGAGTPAVYKWLIVAGLLFCLGGDVFLMLPARYFLYGLVSFLIGHLLYIAAFVADAGLTFSGWLLPLLLFGGGVYALLHAHLGKMRGPVIVYITAILLMAWQAIGRWALLDGTGPLLAAVGACLFVLSDATLALDRFRQKFHAARVIVLTTYWAAQACIALSVWG